MSPLAAKLAALIAYLVGVGAGGAIVARLRGARLRPGRRCGRCGASLSPVAALPWLSWFGVRPRCPVCGSAAPWLPAALETAIVLMGALALITVPLAWSALAIVAGFLLFVLAARRWG